MRHSIILKMGGGCFRTNVSSLIQFFGKVKNTLLGWIMPKCACMFSMLSHRNIYDAVLISHNPLMLCVVNTPALTCGEGANERTEGRAKGGGGWV